MEHTAEIDRNVTGEWAIWIRYVSGSRGSRRTYSKFVLVPESQDIPFSEICAQIEAAIEAHAHRGGTLEASQQ